MPNLGTTSNSITLKQITDFLRTIPDLIPTMGASGYTQEPSLTLANDVAQRFLAPGMNWKWNRAYIPPFLTVGLQQDYMTSVTNAGWLEKGSRLDINNNASNGNRASKPCPTMEAVRDLQVTSGQGIPVQLSLIPNRLAKLGNWQPNAVYGCGYGVPQVPTSPIQQFADANGNLLYIDSTVLGLNETSPGYAGQTIALPVNSPYGVSGSTQPVLAPMTPPGTLVQDGTVTWTVADPDAMAVRLNPAAALGGICWLIKPEYQMVPPTFTALSNTIAPIPNELGFLFRRGLHAHLLMHAQKQTAVQAFQEWTEALQTALHEGDRETENFSMYPSDGLMGGCGGGNLGPAWPFGFGV